MNGGRGLWYLLTGFIVGLALGLCYAWLVQPVEYVNTPPRTLVVEAKDQYRLMIALAYTANLDVVRARERLKLLDDDDPIKALVQQAQRVLAQEGPLDEAHALGILATGLGRAQELPAAATSQPDATETP